MPEVFAYAVKRYLRNEAIYEAVCVKPRCGRRTEKAPCISLAVGVGRSAHLSRHRHPPRALLRPYPEPEVKRDQPLMAVHSSVDSSRGRRNVMRSTIYSGFRTRRIAMKNKFEERRHSKARGSSMGTPSGFVSGSFSRWSRPPGHGLTLCFNY